MFTQIGPVEIDTRVIILTDPLIQTRTDRERNPNPFIDKFKKLINKFPLNLL